MTFDSSPKGFLEKKGTLRGRERISKWGEDGPERRGDAVTGRGDFGNLRRGSDSARRDRVERSKET